MAPSNRLFAAVLLVLGALAVSAGGVALLASQPPGAPVGLLVLPAPWISLRDTALAHALVLGVVGALGWLPGPSSARRLWATLLVSLVLVHGAQIFGALQGARLVVLWPLSPASFVAVVARWSGHGLFAASLLWVLGGRLRAR